MLFTITIASPEVEDFDLKVKIDASHTFADLHQLIRQTCGWGAYKPSVFYICDEFWHRGQRIIENGYEDDTMDEVALEDLLEDEGQRLQYIFDQDRQRGLILEVTNIAFREHIDAPTCVKKHGEAPALEKRFADNNPEDVLAQLSSAALNEDEEETQNDDEGFDPEEFDPEGFEVDENFEL